MAKVKGGKADRHHNQKQFRLILLDGYYQLTRDQNIMWSKKPLDKQGDTEKPDE
jgi:enoyl reductase-like protein